MGRRNEVTYRVVVVGAAPLPHIGDRVTRAHGELLRALNEKAASPASEVTAVQAEAGGAGADTPLEG